MHNGKICQTTGINNKNALLQTVFLAILPTWEGGFQIMKN